MNKNKVASIWKYFEKVDQSGGVSENVKVKCNLCSDAVAYSKKATSNLVTHLQVVQSCTLYGNAMLIAITRYRTT